MQTYPARTSVELTVVGMSVMALGLVLGEAVTVAWGGALVLGVGIARIATQVDVASVRASGFEMA